jgi:hypothetical protein
MLRPPLLILATLLTNLAPSTAHGALGVTSAPIYVADQPVGAVVRSGDTVYIGGSFTQIGPPTGPGVEISSVTGIVRPLAARVSGGLGAVFAAVADGGGGWYVGGGFTHVAGVPRNNLAHILADGTVDSDWDPSPDWIVWSLAVSADGTVYAGGSFAQIGANQAQRAGLAALDPLTGDATGWDPRVASTGVIGGVYALHLATSGVIYAGGSFTAVGSQPRQNVAAVDLASGKPTEWNPSADKPVKAFALRADTLYVGGDFHTIGANRGAHLHLAALDRASGNALPWNADASATVNAIAPATDGTLYIGGYFTTIGANQVARTAIAAVDPTTGNATAWNPQLAGSEPGTNNTQVAGLQIGTDGTVYAAGNFTSTGSDAAARGYLAAIDPVTAHPLAWNPNANNPAYAIAVDGHDHVYAGGAFSSVGGSPRHGLAALNAADGTLSTWNPAPDGAVGSFAFGDDGTVYVGGVFSSIGSNHAARSNLAALDPATGAATAWNPHPNGYITSLGRSADGTVYAAGAFTTIGAAQQRAGLAAVDPAGTVTAWNPAPPVGLVQGDAGTLLVTPQAVYVGGNFTMIGANLQPRHYLAAVDPLTGNATSWAPNPSNPANSPTSNYVNHIARGPDGTIYAAGNFTAIGANNLLRHNLAALSPNTGNATAWAPDPSIEGTTDAYGLVDALAVAPDGTIFVGGSFQTIGADHATRENLAALDPATANATTFSPGLAPWGAESLSVTSDGTLYVGGAFYTTDLAPQSMLAEFVPAPVPPSSTSAPRIDGSPTVGQRLTCLPGTWSVNPTYVSREWLRDANPIPGSAHPYHLVTGEDAGHALTCREVAHNDGGQTTATSNGVNVPANASTNTDSALASTSDGDADVGQSSPPVHLPDTQHTPPFAYSPIGSSLHRSVVISIRVPRSISLAGFSGHGFRLLIRCARTCHVNVALRRRSHPAALGTGHGILDEPGALRIRVRATRAFRSLARRPTSLVLTVVVRDLRGASSTVSRRITARA